MNRLSLQKTRGLFVAFFFALIIPAGILSYKANEQLRWQSLHQFQQDAQALVKQIDGVLIDAINKEEARADTDYTFFVLTGTPEARFVQRSELSKFPVESDIAGIVGYFQIDEKGSFSSPILPSAHVQASVQPQLYGISVEESQSRTQLEKSVYSILSQNQLVNNHKDKPEIMTPLNQDTESKLEELVERSSILEKEYRPKNKPKHESRNNTVQNEEAQRIFKADSSVKNSATKKGKALFSEKRSLKTSDKKALLHSDEGAFNDKGSEQFNKRKLRLEKSYSPQQSLTAKEQSSQRIEPDKIQIKLFESQIEPFRFSLLESGHFVLYRQVWRNQKRLIQGAILSSKEFLELSIGKILKRSTLAKVTDLSVYFSDQVIHLFASASEKGFSSQSVGGQVSMKGEVLSVISLSEPFSDIALEFKIEHLPTSAGAAFINMVAASLLLVLILGCYFLYRLTLKQSNLVQQQQDFVSSVSHELKTPLTSIRMYGEILKQGWVSDEKREEYYDYIYSESERLSRLIANVLQISKVNHNALDLNLVSVEISELASLINSKVDSQIAQNDFSLDISVDPKLSKKTLLVDSDAFVQIIINLVDNSIKYAGKALKKHIDIHFTLEKQNRIHVSVRDYGPGIGKEHIKNVFNLFYRSENELTRETAGTGIGLALVKELVDAMSAKIEVVNHTVGVEFLVSFTNSN